jgi:hypothetical protein
VQTVEKESPKKEVGQRQEDDYLFVLRRTEIDGRRIERSSRKREIKADDSSNARAHPIADDGDELAGAVKV